MKKLNLILLSATLLCTPLFASEQNSCGEYSECIAIDRWDIGIAAGYGERSNPLKDYDDIPIYLAPTIAYYGDSWFFDNGNFGYTLAEQEKYTVNLVTSFSADSAFFYRWDPSNIFIAGTNSFKQQVSAMPMLADSSGKDKHSASKTVFNELETRHFTLLGGAEAFIYTRAGIINLSLAHDMFNVHQGTEAKVKWLYNVAIEQWKFELAAIMNWKSEEIVDYYYGVRPSENIYWSEHFDAKSAINLGMEFTSQFVMTEHWELVFLARYTDIADEIADSPLLNERYSSTFFVGTAYRF
ncbi:MipA/OmpV family protein [Shewanella sp. Scap07]|uniref:MipA/OmpV family protein n=1 Tax=Shewanella sp. Scap07 TaxID=2589987 RepID=UPI0015B7B5B6|nr:MipA/OmpV family protein [Shewanella sp. Scap07]QLE84422.1 MipA/OmpV family protein [Shewanella sp. Scap07]